MLKIALIGCGTHSAAAHAAPLREYALEHPDAVELTAACDLRAEKAERFRDEFGFRDVYTDVESLLSEARPDAVVAVMPLAQITPVSADLLRRGVPTMIEKPLGPTLADARALRDSARESGTPHQVSTNRRFNPFLNAAKTFVTAAGPIRHIDAQMLRRGRAEPRFIWESGIHIVDAVRYLGGDVAQLSIRRIHGGAGDTAWVQILLEMTSGCTASIALYPTAGMVAETVDIFGEGFRAHATTLGGDGPHVRCWRDGALVVEERADPDAPSWRRDGSYEETSAFIDGLRAGAPLSPTLDDVLPSLEICWQAAEAVRSDA